MPTIVLDGLIRYEVETPASGFHADARLVAAEKGLDVIRLALESTTAQKPPVITVRWTVPHTDIQGLWRPEGAADPFPSVWSRFTHTSAVCSAPVACLYASDGGNRHTLAFSNAQDDFSFRLALQEEAACWLCEARLFDSPCEPVCFYEAFLRIDLRCIPYEHALRDVSAWWASMPAFAPRAVPEVCRLPAYSTWYGYHQAPDAAALEAQAHLAAPMGMRLMILDDGWQMEDASRTYAHCGDWSVYAGAFPDMRGFVDRIRALGMQTIVWFALPFVGRHSRAWTRFADKLLSRQAEMATLDPRYPDVRSYLIETCVHALKDWGIDGFKLDFLDSFLQPDPAQETDTPGRDYENVGHAAARLLQDLHARLTAGRETVLYEFRQAYTGPLARRYATMLRASDCPGDFLQNKIRTINLRLLAGQTPVHSDMLLWHRAETPQALVLQLLHVFFAVPQISVRMEALSQAQTDALRFWLSFWRENRRLLLDGALYARHPELGYTLVSVVLDRTFLAVAYCEAVIDLPPGLRSALLINASHTSGLVCRPGATQPCRVSLYDHMGRLVMQEESPGQGSLLSLPVPACGFAKLLYP